MNKSGTVPNFIYMKENMPIFVAGIYFIQENYSEEEPDALKLVLMTQSSLKVKQLCDIHHRMPVFLDSKTISLWLDPSKSFKECESQVLKSKVQYDTLTLEVSDLVNSI